MTPVPDGNEIYRLMVERILDCAIFMLDTDGCVLTWNAGAERIKGYSPAEIIGRHVSLFYPRDDVRSGKPERELLAAAANNRFEREGWRVRKDGSRFLAHVVLTALRDETGELLGFAKLVRDLTAQKRTEAELRRSQERFHNAIESAPNAMLMINRAGRIEMLNLQAEILFGYRRDELLGQPVEILIPGRLRRSHPAHRMAFFADPHARKMGTTRDVFAVDKDGNEFPVEISLSPIETEGGSVVLAAVTDITERKRHEEELRRGQERFQRLVEEAPNPWVLIGEGGRIEMVNWKAERLFGYPREDLLGKPVEILLPERCRKAHLLQRTAFFADPRARAMGKGCDLFGLKRDGSEFPIEVALSPVATGEGLKALAAVVDITERKQNESRIVAALREKEVLLSEVHHRARNSLQIAVSMLHLQSAKIQDEAARGILRDCENRIKSMALVHQTLYQSADLAKVDFAGFLNAMALSLVTSLGVDARRISLSIDTGQVLLPVSAAIACGQIVNELLTNALRHAFPDERRGRIAVTLTKGADGEVILSVADDGVGIPDHVDVMNSTTLGLRLISLLTDQLRGTLSVQRAKPTRFVVRFLLRTEGTPGDETEGAVARSFAQSAPSMTR